MKKVISLFIVLLWLVTIVTAQTDVTYDYNTGAGTSHYAYEIAVEAVFPLSSDWTLGWGGTQIGDYTLIQVDDNTNYWQCVDGGGNFEPVIRFNFTISEPEADINWINVTINGIADYGGGEDADCYVANFNTLAWEKICDMATSDSSCTYNITLNPAYYISDTTNQLVYACEGKNMDVAADLQIDYVSVILQHEESVDDCTCTDGQEWMIDDGSACTLSSACDITGYNFKLIDGSLKILSGGSLKSDSCFIQDGTGLYIDYTSGGVYCGW